MEPKIRKVDNSLERLVLTAMITSDKFLQQVKAIYKPDLVETPFVRTVAGWCLDYFDRYEKAPGVHIQDLYGSKRRNGLDEDQADLIADFLDGLSREYERADQVNVDYLMGQAESLFKERSLAHLAEDIKTLISDGQPLEAEAMVANYKRVERPCSQGSRPLVDKQLIYDAFNQDDTEALYTMPGALGEYLGPFKRGDFIGIMAPEKRGKTFWMLEIAKGAMKQNLNVAFFECGDMSMRQIARRMLCGLAGASTFKSRIRMPVLDCRKNQDNTCGRKERACSFGVLRGEEKATPEEVPDYIPCTACRKDKGGDWVGEYWHVVKEIPPLKWEEAVEIGERMAKKINNDGLYLMEYPADTANVRDLESQLNLWEDEGFVADVVIVDYADILAPIDRRAEFRHQQNQTWLALRALSQKRNVCVITATQADADSYDRASLGLKNFSEDKRKYGHVTHFFTLNQTDREKEDGIMRIGTLLRREGDFSRLRQCVVGMCLDISRPHLFSYIKKGEKIR